MGKRNVILILMLFASYVNYAQYIDIGIRVNTLTYDNSGYNFGKTNDDPDNISARSNKSISADIIVENIKSNNIFFRGKIGHWKTLVNTTYTYNFINEESTVTKNQENYLKYMIAVGLGKLYEFNKLNFKIGGELSFNFTNPKHNFRSSERFDSSGNNYETTKWKYDEPVYYEGGIYIFSNVYYNFWKSFFVGFEISKGFLYYYNVGTITVEYEFYTNGSLTDTDVITDKLNYKSFSTSPLNTSIGLSYKF